MSTLAVLQHEQATGLGAFRRELEIHDVDYEVVRRTLGTMPDVNQVFGWHEDRFDLAPGAVPLAGSMACTCQGFRFGDAAYGLQFHPEVRADELAGWRAVPGYRELAERTGVDFDALRIATPRLDVLAARLVERWLGLAAGPRSVRPAA